MAELRGRTAFALALVATGIAACAQPPGKETARSAPTAAAEEADSRAPNVRPPSAAGSFYPADPGELASFVTSALAAAPRVSRVPIRMVLVPHAGVRFSGLVAAHSFKQLDPGIRRVVILAANHNDEADWDGVAVDQATDYDMPGFRIHVSPLVVRLSKRAGFVDEPRAHTMHMVEIELPFLRAVEGDHFQIVPLVVGRLGPDDPRRVAAVLAELADDTTVFVFSVDLSHYYSYEQSRKLDESCLAALVSTEAPAVARCDTDGTRVLAIMNELGAKLALTPKLIHYQNSGDVTGDKTKVVGYGSLVYEDRFVLGKTEGTELVRLARAALTQGIRRSSRARTALDRSDAESPGALERRLPRLGAPRSAFVTLKKQGILRGCVGSITASEPLADNVVRNAVRAALEDPRFEPVLEPELENISLEVSVLDAPRSLAALQPDALLARLENKQPGVILDYGGRSSTFLPQVWKETPKARPFLEALCEKQGSDSECWRSKKAVFKTFAAQVFEESNNSQR